MALTGKAQIANINSYYDRTLLERALPLLLHVKFGQARNIPRNNSDVIKFRKYNSLTVATTPLTEGVTPAGSQLAVSDLTATVLQYGDYVTLTDKLKMETEDPVETEATQVLGEQAAKTLDELCRDIIIAGTTVQYADGAANRVSLVVGNDLDTAEIRKAVRTLKNANARKLTSMVNAQVGYATSPVDACYVGIVHPNGSYDLKTETAWVPIEKYQGALKNGPMPDEIGKLDEVRFVESTQAKVYTAGGAAGIDVYGCLILGADAFGVTRISGEALKTLRKQLGSAGSADPLDQRSTIGWKATFIAKILDQTAMVRIEHGATA